MDFPSPEGISTSLNSTLRKQLLPLPSVPLGTVIKIAVDNRSLSDYYATPNFYAPFLRSLLIEMRSLFMNVSEVIIGLLETRKL
jgi:hypothetical protein